MLCMRKTESGDSNLKMIISFCKDRENESKSCTFAAR